LKGTTDICGTRHFQPLGNPFGLQRILGRTVALAEHAEESGERQVGRPVRRDLIRRVVAEFVLPGR
jgi:hypothetical protein